MSLSLILACLWVLVATGCTLLPGRCHWPAAWVLIAAGIPILGYVTLENGPIWGLAVLAAGASVLRWPLVALGRYVHAWLRS